MPYMDPLIVDMMRDFRVQKKLLVLCEILEEEQNSKIVDCEVGCTSVNFTGMCGFCLY